jgi:5-methylcytosine-specific restriction endonuclease McrA
MESEIKKCIKCGDEKPATSEFWYRHKGTKDGFHAWCKSCNSVNTKEYYKSNREKYIAYHKSYQKVNIKKMRENKKKYLESNRDKILEHRRNRSKERYLIKKEWIKQGDLTKDQLKEIYQLSNGNCNYCGTKVSNPRFYPYCLNGFDHVIPRVKGGKHTASNIVVCCYECNTKKSIRDVSEFMAVNANG